MNYEPVKNVLLVLLGSAGGFFINKGWLSAEQWASIAGAVVTLTGVAWAAWKGQSTNVVATAANLDVVDQIKVNSIAVAAAAPANVVPSPNAVPK